MVLSDDCFWYIAHFAAAQQFGRFRSEADIEPRSPSRIYEYMS